MLEEFKVDDLVEVINSSPYINKGTVGYINEIFNDGTVSFSEIDSIGDIFVPISDLKKIE